MNPKKRFSNLSRGEKLKVQLAFALSYHPNLLILDEPTGNFDPEFRKKFIEILKEFVADGTRSVILSTHLMEELEQIGDYILYLENGQLRFFDDIETIRTEYFPKDVWSNRTDSFVRDFEALYEKFYSKNVLSCTNGA